MIRMRRGHVGWSVLAAAMLLALSAREAEACGDKFVRVGRGGRFQRGYVAVHPSAILVFVNAGSPGAASMRRLPATLRAAGHTPLAVTSASDFEEALKARRYDIVMAEAADLPRLSAALAVAVSRPEVLPILRKPTKAEADAAARANAHACVIVDVDKKYDVLVDIDQVMAARK